MNLQHLVVSTVLLLCACSREETSSGSKPTAPASGLSESYWLAAAPASAKNVLALRQDAKSGDAVVVQGKVNDFVKGLAAFTMVDLSYKSCDLEGPMPDCDTPWDYCCTDQSEIARATATVEFREGAKVLLADARGFHGLDYLAQATVEGTLSIDERGNLAVIAKGVHVAK